MATKASSIPDKLLETVRPIICDNLGCEESEVTLNASFIDDLGADSLDSIEILMCVEEEFNLTETPDEDAEKIKTVGDLIKYLESKKVDVSSGR